MEKPKSWQLPKFLWSHNHDKTKWVCAFEPNTAWEKHAITVDTNTGEVFITDGDRGVYSSKFNSVITMDKDVQFAVEGIYLQECWTHEHTYPRELQQGQRYCTFKRKHNSTLIEHGIFLQFGVAFEEFESGPGNYSTALIELPSGEIAETYPTFVKFVNQL